MNDARSLWDTFERQLCWDETTGFLLDVSRVGVDDPLVSHMRPRLDAALAAMRALEAGAIANPDENRQVGHYWLRDADRAPTPEVAAAIGDTLKNIRAFAAAVRGGHIAPPGQPRFTRLLVVGIGGSALGPQLVADALGSASDALVPSFFDNTDPDGFDRVLAQIGDDLARTLTIVISKSGGTKETRNGMLEAQAAYRRRGLDPAPCFVAVTGEGSELDRLAVDQRWRARFPMWDWVGGRTSEMCAVGLLPAALQGLDIDGMLDGARAMDALTRGDDVRANPALLMALAWHKATNGKGDKDLVVLPYKDRLILLSRYLQQLVMESLGKERDLAGAVVHQGIAVYGNKGSTDQHAYVQQLRDGVPNFFATFIDVRKHRDGAPLDVEPGMTSGDYLHGFLLGTRRALHEGGRASILISVPVVDARTLGMLIALFERTVGFYATLVNVNAYHQPGVEAGKKAAAQVLAVQGKVVAALSSTPQTAAQVAAAIGANDDVETVWHVLMHLAENGRARRTPAARVTQSLFSR